MFAVKGFGTILNHQEYEIPLLLGRLRGLGQAPNPAGPPNYFRDKTGDPSFFFQLSPFSLSLSLSVAQPRFVQPHLEVRNGIFSAALRAALSQS